MKDDDLDSDGEALRKLIASAVESCTDISLLDLVYKLLVYEDNNRCM